MSPTRSDEPLNPVFEEFLTATALALGEENPVISQEQASFLLSVLSMVYLSETKDGQEAADRLAMLEDGIFDSDGTTVEATDAPIPDDGPGDDEYTEESKTIELCPKSP